MAGIEGGRPQGDLIPFRDTRQTAEGNLPVAVFFGKLSETPPHEDPAYWPAYVLDKLNGYIDSTGEYTADSRLEALDMNIRELGERLTPMQEPIQKVTTAYKILAYPHCKYEGNRQVIEDNLERRAFGDSYVPQVTSL
jgi:hypothetical protein